VDPTTRRVHGPCARLRFPYPRHRYFPLPFPFKQHATILTASHPTASGLYYLSELVEEHTVIAKKLLTRLIYLVMGIHVFLCVVDGFPVKDALVSVVSHAVYLGNMRRFPVVRLGDPLFLVSCGMLLFPFPFAPLPLSLPFRRKMRANGREKCLCYSTTTSGSLTSLPLPCLRLARATTSPTCLRLRKLLLFSACASGWCRSRCL